MQSLLGQRDFLYSANQVRPSDTLKLLHGICGSGAAGRFCGDFMQALYSKLSENVLDRAARDSDESVAWIRRMSEDSKEST